MARQASIGSGYPAPKNEPRRRRPRGAGRDRGGKGRGRAIRNPITAPLTKPADVGREVRASSNLRFRPVERRLGAERRASVQRERQVGDWWGSYLEEVNRGRAETAAAYAAAGDQGTAALQAAGARDAANTQALQAEAAQSAALRGATPDTNAAQREAAAAAQRSYLAAAQVGALGREGAAQYSYLTDQRRIGAGQRIASRKEEQRRTRNIDADRRDLSRERGEYATAKRAEIRGEERDYLIQRRAFPEAQAERRQEAREGALERQQRWRENQADNTQDERASQRSARDDGSSGGMTPSERRDAREGRRNAVSVARRLIRQHGAPSSAKEWADLQEAVEDASEVSPTEARYAVKRLKARINQQRKKKAQQPSESPFPKGPVVGN